MAADVTKLLRRHEALKRKRSLIEQNWREGYDYTFPIRGAQLALTSGGANPSIDENAAHSYARAQQARILDSTAADCVRTLASAVVSGSTPGNTLWVGYGVKGQDAEDLPDDVRIFLDDGATIIWKNIHNSNFDAVHFECEIDTCIPGWFVMFVDEDEDGGYIFEQWAIAGVWAAASKPGGPLDIFHREVSITAEQCVNNYGPEMVSEAVRRKAEQSPDELVTVIQTVYPREAPHGQLSKNLPIASCHIERDTRKLVREKGYHEHPIIAPRWLLVPNSVYPLGPIFDAMPDIKSLNKAIEMSFANMDLALAGMWIAEDDGVLNPRTLKVGPRKVVVANSVDSMKPLEPPGKFELGAIEVERLQRAIRRVMMADHLEPQPMPGQKGTGAPITATQAQINVELIRQLLGPIYGRWLAEFVKPLLTRCFGIAYRAGVLGQAPDSLRGKELTIKYRSPIAKAQQMVDVAAMDRYEVAVGQEMAAGITQVADNYDWDKATRKRAELLGVPADLMVDEDERDAKREQRKQAQQQQAGAAAATEMASAAMKGAK